MRCSMRQTVDPRDSDRAGWRDNTKQQIGESMEGIQIGTRAHRDLPRLTRPGLRLDDIVLGDTDSNGKRHYSVTISSGVCDVTLHNIPAEYVPELTSGAFDLALWSVK